MFHVVYVLHGGFFADGGYAACSEAAGDLAADVEAVGGEGFVEGLRVGVDGPE